MKFCWIVFVSLVYANISNAEDHQDRNGKLVLSGTPFSVQKRSSNEFGGGFHLSEESRISLFMGFAKSKKNRKGEIEAPGSSSHLEIGISNHSPIEKESSYSHGLYMRYGENKTSHASVDERVIYKSKNVGLAYKFGGQDGNISLEPYH